MIMPTLLVKKSGNFRNLSMEYSVMKKIESVLKPFKLDEVKEALEDEGVENVIVTDIRLFGQKKDKSAVYEDSEYVMDFLPKIKIEFMVPSEKVEKIVMLIRSLADTGRPGDGYITVYSVEDLIQMPLEED